jgi:dTDP-glucose 4,6-dehydratase
MVRSDHAGPINIGNPTELTVQQIAQDVVATTGSGSVIRYVERPVDDPQVRRPDTALAQRVLGWQPRVSWLDGLSRTVDWFARAQQRPA